MSVATQPRWQANDRQAHAQAPPRGARPFRRAGPPAEGAVGPRPDSTGLWPEPLDGEPSADDGGERSYLVFRSAIARARAMPKRRRSDLARSKSPMDLTSELVERCRRDEPDPGPEPGRHHFTEAEY